jgi:hypothetical protein
MSSLSNPNNRWTTRDISDIVDRTGVLRVGWQRLLTCHLVSLVIEKATEKIGYKVCYISVLVLGLCLKVYLFSQEVKTVSFCMGGESGFSTVYLLYRFYLFWVVTEFQNFETTIWRSYNPRNTTGFHEWTDGNFMEPCVLLLTASTVLTSHAVI